MEVRKGQRGQWQSIVQGLAGEVRSLAVPGRQGMKDGEQKQELPGERSNDLREEPRKEQSVECGQP